MGKLEYEWVGVGVGCLLLCWELIVMCRDMVGVD